MEAFSAFIGTLWSDWWSRMTGLASIAVPLVAYAFGVHEKELWWAIAYLFLILAAFRAWQLEWVKPGPQVVIVYETPNKKNPDAMDAQEYDNWRSAGGGGRLTDSDRLIKLENLSDIPAINVRIQNVTVGPHTATFPVVPSVIRGHPVMVETTILDTSPVFAHHFGVLLQAGMEAAKSLDELTEGLSVQLFIYYEDMHGRKFETECEVQYGPYRFTTFTRRYKRRK